MRLPRFILNPAVGPWVRLWQQERKESQRLRRELYEWQGKFLQQVNVTPLFTPPPKPVEAVESPPVGPLAKKAFLARQANPNDPLTAEQIASNGNP